MKPTTTTTSQASAEGDDKATATATSVAPPRTPQSLPVTSPSSSGSGGARRRSKKLPLNILNFPQNLPVHLSEIDLMIESDGVARTTGKFTETTIEPIQRDMNTHNNSHNNSAAPATPVLALSAATASTTNYSDETGNNQPPNKNNNKDGDEAVDNNNNNNNNTVQDGIAAINPTLPQSKLRPSLNTGRDNGRRQKDQVDRSNLPATTTTTTASEGDNDDEEQERRQMTKNISDVRNNKKSRVYNDDDDNGIDEEGKRTTSTTGFDAAAASDPWKSSRAEGGGVGGVSYTNRVSTDEDFIRKGISIDDDSSLTQHYIITSSGDIENIPLANQHIVSQFRENFINEIMPLNSVEKAFKVDNPPPPPTLILDTYPSMASRSRSGGAPLFRDQNIQSST